MRLLLLLCLTAAIALPGASGSVSERVAAGHGLSVVLPAGWRLSRHPVTACTGPEQVLVAVTGRVRLRTSLRIPPRVALVLLMEGGGSGFPARPARFTLPRLGENLGGCCEMPVGPGAELLFRDHGRRFYAFVYIGDRAGSRARQEAVGLLDSLRVSWSR